MEFEVQQHVLLRIYCWLALSMPVYTHMGVLFCQVLSISRCLFSRLNNRYITQSDDNGMCRIH